MQITHINHHFNKKPCSCVFFHPYAKVHNCKLPQLRSPIWKCIFPQTTYKNNCSIKSRTSPLQTWPFLSKLIVEIWGLTHPYKTGFPLPFSSISSTCSFLFSQAFPSLPLQTHKQSLRLRRWKKLMWGRQLRDLVFAVLGEDISKLDNADFEESVVETDANWIESMKMVNVKWSENLSTGGGL